MTDRLYYTDSFLQEFTAQIRELVQVDGTPALILDRTAFYPTSGGQRCDTGMLRVTLRGSEPAELRVVQVGENGAGDVVHILQGSAAELEAGLPVEGRIDIERRRDHIQQHSGQHVLSAAFITLFDIPTVSFHMGEDVCTIDLATQRITAEQRTKAEELANRIVWENRPVAISFVDLERARDMGVRKLPALGKIAAKTSKGEPGGNAGDESEGALIQGGHQLRLIDIGGFDLNACGGTHVASTAQIGPILIRKTEKIARGVRVEFVCGDRALKAMQRDFQVLTEAAAVFSTHLWEVPQQARKSLDDLKAAQKANQRLSGELAEVWAEMIYREAPDKDGYKVVKRVFPDRDLAFTKILAQKLAKHPRVLILLGTTAAQPSVVFARSQDLSVDVSLLMKEVLAGMHGRGGGSPDLAQGGLASADQVNAVVDAAAEKSDGLLRRS
ncbi:MAG TPA: DHHA1 domain-containing protein [Terriglobales bacterium]|nr:DHHA1 domain-containing protein [Terriglobales bacterium]